MKDILKRLLVVVHYLLFILGSLGILDEISRTNINDETLWECFGLLILGPILKFIFVGKFLIFPWSKVKVDE